MLKPISVLQILHTIFLATVLIGVVVAALSAQLGFVPIYDTEDWLLHVTEAAFGFITVIVLLLGYYWPRLSRRFTTANSPEIVEVMRDHVFRMAFFEAVAVSGFMLGAIMGSSWYICLPFFLLSGVALILTFPTEERWNRWMDNRSKS